MGIEEKIEKLFEKTFEQIKEINNAFNEFSKNYKILPTGEITIRKQKSDIAPYYEISASGIIEVKPSEKGDCDLRNPLIDDDRVSLYLVNNKYFMVLKGKNSDNKN